MGTERVHIISTRFAQVPGARLPGQIEVFRWCLISTSPQYVTVLGHIIFYWLPGLEEISETLI